MRKRPREDEKGEAIFRGVQEAAKEAFGRPGLCDLPPTALRRSAAGRFALWRKMAPRAGLWQLGDINSLRESGTDGRSEEFPCVTMAPVPPEKANCPATSTLASRLPAVAARPMREAVALLAEPRDENHICDPQNRTPGSDCTSEPLLNATSGARFTLARRDARPAEGAGR
jgi:hypothetical protein